MYRRKKTPLTILPLIQIIILKVNEEDQTKIMDMMSEVVISRSLSNLRSGSSNKTTGTVVLIGSTLHRTSLNKVYDVIQCSGKAI